MKTFMSEYASNYDTYTFGYTQYAVLESMNEIDQIYSQGFLPYSNNLTLSKSLFYLCRSLRVDTHEFRLSSENRRVARKGSEHNITRTLHHKSEFAIYDPTFEKFCLCYAHARYGADKMPLARLQYILSRDYANYIMEYKSGDRTIGYVYFVMGETSMHYWFSYFDTTWMDKLPIGTYMMSDMLQRAQAQGLNHVYLGTCYNESGLYKVRNFNSIQRRDGNTRQANVEDLKAHCLHDGEVKHQDKFKNYPQRFLGE